MTISKLDHFTIVTDSVAVTAEFYEYTLGLKRGPRPNFAVPGEWLYYEGDPVLHVVEQELLPSTGPLDHVAFRGTDLTGFIDRLKARGVSYDLRRLPEGGPSSGAWQLFFHGPNGARLEIHVAAGDALSLQG
jgi:catechol 2,3-dioxygenase-like lactoylglutathione lyase family enzyme